MMSSARTGQRQSAAAGSKQLQQAPSKESESFESSSEEEEEEEDGLLPEEISPVHYALRLVPNYADWTFAARLVVSLIITGETDLLQFNAADLNVIEATVRTAPGEDLKPSRIQHDEDEEVTTLRFDEPLRIGEATLTIDYTGRIGNEMVGLYRSHYTHAGTQHTILVTQFEACDARRCLPCWDEPARKATFALTLVVPSTMQALSNMPVISSRRVSAAEPGRVDTEDWTEVRFDTTPIMSSYLLAFVIGQFESVQTSTKTGLLVRLLTPFGKIHEAEFSLSFAARCIEFYEDFFSLKFPLPKMDLVAVPDIAITAMENWGLCTFGETALLVHPTDSSLSGKQWVARLVAHEIAHQWFGNITTMEWWTDLWLNEGFASWMEYFAVDAMFPSWNMWKNYLVVRFNYSLQADAVLSSHPVETPIDDPADIDEVFDEISYSKGSVLIRMLQAYLGPEPFRAGLSKYLHEYAYKNAVTADLWRVLSESSGQGVQEMMGQWSKQTGFPLLQVRQIKYTPTGVSLEMTQRRFLLTGPQDKDTTKWSLPLQLVVAGSKSTQAQLFKTESGKLDFTFASSETAASTAASSSQRHAFKLNAGQTYLYRVAYPQPHYALLRSSLFSFNAEDRVGLQNDLFAAVRAGMLPFSILGDFVETLAGGETDYTVWLDLSINLQDLGWVLKHSGEVYAKFCAWVCILYRQMLSNIGWDARVNEDNMAEQNMLRGQLIKHLAIWGDVETVREACRRFHTFIVGENTAKAAAGTQAAALAASAAASSADSIIESSTLLPDLREGVYHAVVAHGGILGYEMMMSRYLSQVAAGGSREEQVRCLNALAATPDKSTLSRTLDWALDQRESVRVEDCSELLAHAAMNSMGTHVWWDFTKRRWKDIVDMFEGAFCLPRLVSMGAQFSSDALTSEFSSFLKKNKAPTAERAVKQTVERMQSNSKWLARDEKNILKFCTSRLAQSKVATAPRSKH